MNRRLASAVLAALTVLAMLAMAVPAAACTVCYGNADDDGFILGAKLATFVMVGVTYTLLSGGVATFVLLRRRARKSETSLGAES